MLSLWRRTSRTLTVLSCRRRTASELESLTLHANATFIKELAGGVPTSSICSRGMMP